MVRPDRVELPTFWFVARRSIQLSYGRTRWRANSFNVPSRAALCNHPNRALTCDRPGFPIPLLVTMPAISVTPRPPMRREIYGAPSSSTRLPPGLLLKQFRGRGVGAQDFALSRKLDT